MSAGATGATGAIGAIGAQKAGESRLMRSASAEEIQSCMETLKTSSWFMFCSEDSLHDVALKMRKEVFEAGQTIIYQGKPHKQMFVIADGTVDRVRMIEGKQHLLDVDEKGSTVGAFYIMNEDPCYSDAVCRTRVVCYSITSRDLLDLFSNPVFAREVAYNLNLEIRRLLVVAGSFGKTPLLEQHARSTPYFAISIAAAIESFYRAAMNAFLNAAISGQTIPKGGLFPNMHLQVPTRIVYINGFKGLRYAVDNSEVMKNAGKSDHPTLMRLGAAIAPGVIMTPVSSLLEAYNAAHANKEPLLRRATRGAIPRCGREVIFGIGLNQLSDYCEERVGFANQPLLRTAAASIVAGVIAGYLSHVPHNISTLKILNPQKSYRDIIRDYCQQSASRLPLDLSEKTKRLLSYPVSVIFPRGYLIRTMQIVGSFIILNGTINTLQNYGMGRLGWQPPAQPIPVPEGIDTSQLFVDHRVELMRRVKIERGNAASGVTPPTAGHC